MCTVLQQHLARQNMTAGFDPPNDPRGPSPIMRLTPQPTYSYLGAAVDSGFGMKKPIDPYDRKISAPTMHYHVPPSNPDGTRPSSRSRSSYSQQLWGRSRSHSRTGMKVLVDELKSSTPRPKSPHMNNEEPINYSHYPDGHPPNGDDEVDQAKVVENGKPKRRRKKKPIERDDFPAPPAPFLRTRHWSEPMRSSSSEDDEPIETVESSSEPEEEIPDPKLDKTEAELKKISIGMASVFLSDLAVERQRRKSARSTRHIDPRSAARTPAANREPHFKLRYDSPVNASPSRIADHLRPWDDDYDESMSRRSFFSATPFLPSTPGLVGAAISPKPGGRKSSTLPSRHSPAHPGSSGPGLNYSTDFSTDMSDGGGEPVKPVRVLSAYAPTPPSSNMASAPGGGSLPNMPPSLLAATDDEDDFEYMVLPQAPNVYPMHLLLTTNYRLPGDVDRCNLERHLTDADFEATFRCLRDDFYRLPYWKRCDLKRRANLF